MIQIVTKEQLRQIEKKPLLDMNKGKYAALKKNKYICIDNSSGKPHKKICDGIVEAVKWFNGIQT